MAGRKKENEVQPPQMELGEKTKYTTVPGPKHVVAQALLAFHIKDQCPKRGWMVSVYPECEYRESLTVKYRADVLAKYITSTGKAQMIYEFQTDLDVKTFVKKMERLGLKGEIIKINEMPDDINEASDWIRDRVVIPSLDKIR